MLRRALAVVSLLVVVDVVEAGVLTALAGLTLSYLRVVHEWKLSKLVFLVWTAKIL